MLGKHWLEMTVDCHIGAKTDHLVRTVVNGLGSCA